MLNFHRVARLLDRMFPSVPPKRQAQILAAMEGRDLQAPVPAPLGEDGVGTGDTLASGPVDVRPGLEPLADGPVPRLPSASTNATTAPTSLGAGGHCGDGTASERAVPAQAPQHGRRGRAPVSETFVDWAPHPSHRYLFTDERLALLLSQWGAPS